jgi:hypothetical protein
MAIKTVFVFQQSLIQGFHLIIAIKGSPTSSMWFLSRCFGRLDPDESVESI